MLIWVTLGGKGFELLWATLARVPLAGKYAQAIVHCRHACAVAPGQGFCCLMQLSTRSEDFLVDVLALRPHVGPVLAPVFADTQVLPSVPLSVPSCCTMWPCSVLTVKNATTLRKQCMQSSSRVDV